jgi:hypothetical protein
VPLVQLLHVRLKFPDHGFVDAEIGGSGRGPETLAVFVSAAKIGALTRTRTKKRPRARGRRSKLELIWVRGEVTGLRNPAKSLIG